MTKTTTMGLAAAALLSMAAASQASVLVNETFSYADGTTLTGETPTVGGPWTTISGTADQVTVTGGKTTLVQTTQSEDLAVAFAGGTVAAAGSVFYAGYDLTVPTATTISNVYFSGFNSTPTIFAGRTWVAAPTTPGAGFRLGLSNDSSITDADGEVFTGDLAFGTTYRVVVKYDFDAKQATLYVNPADATATGLVATDPGFSDPVGSFFLREASSSGNTTQVLDNLIVATTLTEAIGGTAIPEPASLAALAGVAVLGLRRRGR